MEIAEELELRDEIFLFDLFEELSAPFAIADLRRTDAAGEEIVDAEVLKEFVDVLAVEVDIGNKVDGHTFLFFLAKELDE